MVKKHNIKAHDSKNKKTEMLTLNTAVKTTQISSKYIIKSLGVFLHDNQQAMVIDNGTRFEIYIEINMGRQK